MGLNFAIDELVSTGWSGLDSSGCGFDGDGRSFPLPARVRNEFAQAGFNLSIETLDRFKCVRASWREVGNPRDAGAVVSHSEEEAAVFALAQLRRSLMTASA